jgi:membrane protease YdiL (CAAX protease family)
MKNGRGVVEGILRHTTQGNYPPFLRMTGGRKSRGRQINVSLYKHTDLYYISLFTLNTDMNLKKLIKAESGRLSEFCINNYREIAVIGLTAIFVTLQHYHNLEPYWAGALLYFFLLPVLSTILILRRNPLDFGLRFGDVKAWGPYVLLTLIIAIPVLYALSGMKSLEEYYTRESLNLLVYSGTTIVYLFAWEFLFRGFMLFGLKDRLGTLSIVVQMIPFVILHFGKPDIEVISTIFTGLWFGYICYRGNSFWPAFIIHVVINISFIIFVNIL